MRMRLWASVAVLLSALSGTWQATISGSHGGASLFVRLPHSQVELGPGACEVDGVIYPSGSALPMDHPCHYCVCFEAQVTCYWKQCAAPPIGCEVMHFENVCNPSLYMCKIPEKAVAPPVREFGARINSLRRRRRFRSIPESGKQLPVQEPFPVELNEEFVERLERSLGSRFPRAINGSHHHHHHHDPHDKSCTILGVKYNLGEVIGVATDVCMECRCAAGKMFCSPKCCFLPSPLRLPPSFPASHNPNGVGEDTEIQPHPLYTIGNQYDA